MATTSPFGNLSSLANELVTPLDVLSEFGEQLRTATDQILDFQIIRDTDFADPNTFVLTFYITAETLKDYRFKLLEAHHGASQYPVKLLKFASGTPNNVKDSNNLRGHLRLFFSTTSVKNALAGILAQAKSETQLRKNGRVR